MGDKKIEIEVPVGYDFVRNGMEIEFVKREGALGSLNWQEKDSNVRGYCVSRISDVYNVENSLRNDLSRNIFAKESQAKGMIAMAMLSQQLADVNGDWEPGWGEKEIKYCISREFSGDSLDFRVIRYWRIYHFLSFKTKEDAEKFLEVNIDEIELAKDFI